MGKGTSQVVWIRSLHFASLTCAVRVYGYLRDSDDPSMRTGAGKRRFRSVLVVIYLVMMAMASP